MSSIGQQKSREAECLRLEQEQRAERVRLEQKRVTERARLDTLVKRIRTEQERAADRFRLEEAERLRVEQQQEAERMRVEQEQELERLRQEEAKTADHIGLQEVEGHSAQTRAQLIADDAALLELCLLLEQDIGQPAAEHRLQQLPATGEGHGNSPPDSILLPPTHRSLVSSPSELDLQTGAFAATPSCLSHPFLARLLDLCSNMLPAPSPSTSTPLPSPSAEYMWGYINMDACNDLDDPVLYPTAGLDHTAPGYRTPRMFFVVPSSMRLNPYFAFIDPDNSLVLGLSPVRRKCLQSVRCPACFYPDFCSAADLPLTPGKPNFVLKCFSLCSRLFAENPVQTWSQYNCYQAIRHQSGQRLDDLVRFQQHSDAVSSESPTSIPLEASASVSEVHIASPPRTSSSLSNVSMAPPETEGNGSADITMAQQLDESSVFNGQFPDIVEEDITLLGFRFRDGGKIRSMRKRKHVELGSYLDPCSPPIPLKFSLHRRAGRVACW